MSDAATRWLDDEPERPRSARRVSPLVAAALPWLVIAGLILRGPAPSATTGSAAQDPAAIDVADLGTDVGPDDGRADGRADGPDDSPDDGPEDGAHGPSSAGSGGARNGPPDGSATGTSLSEGAPADPPPGGELSTPRSPPPSGDTGGGLAYAGSIPALPDLPGITRISHGAAESLALALTRAWLSDAGPDLAGADLPVERRGYLEHASVERIDLAAADAAVATVMVVLLERSGDAYVGALLRRVAVPLALTETTVHPGGTPWWLPGAPDLTPVPPELTPLEDAASTRAVLEALTSAGYRDATITAVATTPSGIYVAEVTATTPDGEQVGSPVWLRPTPDGAEVLGHRPDATV